jgi:NitT/TauT family transport system permease protein
MNNNFNQPVRIFTDQLTKKYSHWIILVSVIGAFLVWEMLIRTFNFPTFILPRPSLVFLRFWQVLVDGSLLHHLLITLTEVLLGLLFGSLAATFIGYFLAKSNLLNQLLSPYLVASQAVPIVAIAPLLIIWFGSGMFSKVLICALIVFFPVLVNTVVGLRAVPENLRDLMISMRAHRLQMLRFLEIPAALPIFLGGLRVGATLSVIGAVVGEFVGADRGLGFMVNVGRGQYDTALVFVAIFTLVSLALGLYGIVILLEKHYLAWQRR